MKTKLNIFVTGASGFIGKQLTLQLLEEGYKVIAITRQSRPPFEFPDLIWTSWEEYSKAISLNDSIFAVFNLVTTYGHKGENFSEIHKCNVAKPLELFKYAIKKGTKKIINADTFFGKTKFNYQHLQNYIKSKNELIRTSKEIIPKKDISFINLRLEHVFGPNDGPNKFVSKLIKDFQSNVKNISLTDGTQKRDFIYIKDVVSAFICVLEDTSYERFIEYEVGTGKSIQLKHFCSALANVFDIPIENLDFGAIDHRPNEISDSYADISALNKIGWEPKWDLFSAVSDLALRQDLL